MHRESLTCAQSRRQKTDFALLAVAVLVQLSREGTAPLCNRMSTSTSDLALSQHMANTLAMYAHQNLSLMRLH
jgi:hypothetical protein